jgi:uncharacterized protein YdhG (YjbR/CyaY superfamily)
MAGGSHSSRSAAWSPAWSRFEHRVAKRRAIERKTSFRPSSFVFRPSSFVLHLSSFVYHGTLMSTNQAAPSTIDEYIASFPDHVQAILKKIRGIIHEAAPDAKEAISYAMPTFTLNGRYLVYFAAYKKHIGMYPIPAGDAALSAEIAPYIAGKGTLKFPLDLPIPFGLIARMVKYSAEENTGRAVAKAKQN